MYIKLTEKEHTALFGLSTPNTPNQILNSTGPDTVTANPLIISDILLNLMEYVKQIRIPEDSTRDSLDDLYHQLVIEARLPEDLAKDLINYGIGTRVYTENTLSFNHGVHLMMPNTYSQPITGIFLKIHNSNNHPAEQYARIENSVNKIFGDDLTLRKHVPGFSVNDEIPKRTYPVSYQTDITSLINQRTTPNLTKLLETYGTLLCKGDKYLSKLQLPLQHIPPWDQITDSNVPKLISHSDLTNLKSRYEESEEIGNGNYIVMTDAKPDNHVLNEKDGNVIFYDLERLCIGNPALTLAWMFLYFDLQPGDLNTYVHTFKQAVKKNSLIYPLHTGLTKETIALMPMVGLRALRGYDSNESDPARIQERDLIIKHLKTM
jgi:hypothetical protein